MDCSKLFKQLVQSWFGEISVKVDRQKQFVTLTMGEKTEILTYDQFFDFVEGVNNGEQAKLEPIL
jgi:hypothetical protein